MIIERRKKSASFNEAINLTKLKGIEEIPVCYDYSYKNNTDIIIENLLGPSIKKILSFERQGLDLATVTILGIQMINILKSIHDRFIIHNDIRPSNICWGKFNQGTFEQENKFFLIDFGYSKEFVIDEKNFIANNTKKREIFHYANKKDNKIQGTPEFMAIKLAEGNRPSRRTDFEELIYTLIYLIKNTLPWSHVKGKNYLEICEKMGEIKRNINIDKLFCDIPEEFKYIYKNIIKLDFDETPEYNLYLLLLKNVLKGLNIDNYNNYSFSFYKHLIDSLGNNLSEKMRKEFLNGHGYLFEGYPIIISS